MKISKLVIRHFYTVTKALLEISGGNSYVESHKGHCLKMNTGGGTDDCYREGPKTSTTFLPW